MQIPAGTFLDKENQTRRCPCVLLLDTSSSMANAPIESLNAALPQFKEAILGDNTARNAVELAVVTFGGSPRVIQDWTDIDHLALPSLVASGGTPLGPALQLAMDMIDARRQLHKQTSIQSYVPWIFILTDGAPDEGEELNAAISRVQQLQQTTPPAQSPKLIVYACSTDSSAQAMGRLKAVTGRTYELKGLAYREVFLWLSASLKIASRATPGAPTTLPPTGTQMTLSQARTITL